jgi:predicted HicB family RNase H-like nuclease
MPTATATKSTAAKKRVVKKTAAAPAPKRDGRGQIQTRLPHDLIERLEIEAVRRRVSKTFLVEQMIADALPAWEDQPLAV